MIQEIRNVVLTFGLIGVLTFASANHYADAEFTKQEAEKIKMLEHAKNNNQINDIQQQLQKEEALQAQQAETTRLAAEAKATADAQQYKAEQTAVELQAQQLEKARLAAKAKAEADRIATLRQAVIDAQVASDAQATTNTQPNVTYSRRSRAS